MAAVHPLKIVVFTGGAELQSAVLDFIERLESNESLDLVGVFCETDSPGPKGVLLDLWRRRGRTGPGRRTGPARAGLARAAVWSAALPVWISHRFQRN